ncbi:DUF4160 domain-containing protein [Vibrio sp. HN007]|uniref:type II toxin-antitoxin system toxin DhiT n=1 Tax=Vibrio iocasae TaxID=3098914 RepID=UPI0035D3F2BC
MDLYPKRYRAILYSTLTMPEILKRLLGLKFCMRYLDEDFHHRPHLHVSYGDFEASIAIDAVEILAGYLPDKQRKKAESYICQYQQALIVEWNKAVKGNQIRRIN